FFWGLATCFAALAIFEGRKWAWVAMGIAAGMGLLSKFTMGVWLGALVIFLICDREGRRCLRSRWPWIGLAIAMLFMVPMILWNIQHGWVSLRHVAKDTGTGATGHFTPAGILEFFGGQLGAAGPPLFVILCGAIVYTLSGRE